MIKTYRAIDFRELVKNSYSLFHDQRRRVVWLGVARCMDADAYDEHEEGSSADVDVIEATTTQEALLELHLLRCKALSARAQRARDACLEAARELVGSDDVGVFVHFDVDENEYVARVIFPTRITGATWLEMSELLRVIPVGVLAQGTDAYAPERALESLLAVLLRMARRG